MGLRTYKAKRTFSRTPEPSPILPPKKKSTPLIFCVQKHAASHLHYDFRLECKGVLLSWAIPKGPSMNPQDKRLAIHVEDHPYDYHDFEGTIPEGNYGAGTVMLWDEGTYTVPDADTKEEEEKLISQGVKKGRLEFELHGEKLKGLFALVKIKDTEKNWLFIKVKDSSASTKDVTKQDRSVKTQRSLKEISGEEDEDPPAEKKKTVRKSPAKKTTTKKKVSVKKKP